MIGSAWVIVGLLAWWGMAVAARARDPAIPQALADRLYLTMDLFGRGFPLDAARADWRIDVARFFGPVVAGVTFFSGVLTIFGDRIREARLRRARGHVVVCGLGEKGFRLASGFAAEGRKVAVVEKDKGAPRLASARERGVVVVEGDATDPDVLRRVGAPRAGDVIVVCGDDGTNAEVAAALRPLVKAAGGRQPVRISVHLLDPTLCALLRQQALREAGAGIRLEYFNVYSVGAAIWLGEHLPLHADAAAGGHAPHVVIIGLGPLGRSLVLAAAQRWTADHDPGDARVRLTLVDRDARARREALLLAHPTVAGAVGIDTVDLDFDLPAEGAAAEFRAMLQGTPPEVVFVTIDDDRLALSTGLLVRQALPPSSTRVVVRTSSEEGLAVLLRDDARTTGAIGVQAFSLLDRACTPAVIEGGLLEQVARAIHDDYLARTAAEGRSAGEFGAPWSALPEPARASNRAAAESIAAGLAAIDCDIGPARGVDGGGFAFTRAEIDLLARREHERWMAERRASGWTYGATRDDEEKRNPLLRDWDDLSAADSAYNRAAAADLPRLLARAGFQIIRLTPASRRTRAAP